MYKKPQTVPTMKSLDKKDEGEGKKSVEGEFESTGNANNDFFTPNIKIDFSNVKIEPLFEDVIHSNSNQHKRITCRGEDEREEVKGRSPQCSDCKEVQENRRLKKEERKKQTKASPHSTSPHST